MIDHDEWAKLLEDADRMMRVDSSALDALGGAAERVTTENAQEFLTLADAVIFALGNALKN